MRVRDVSVEEETWSFESPIAYVHVYMRDNDQVYTRNLATRIQITRQLAYK